MYISSHKHQSTKGILLCGFLLFCSMLLQCCQSPLHALEEAASLQEAPHAMAQQESFSEASAEPAISLGASFSGEGILPTRSASETADTPGTLIPRVFTAFSGELVQFVQLDTQWQAVVRENKTWTMRQRTLPVKSADKDISQLLTQLRLHDNRSSKARIHIVQKDDSPGTACVYLGQLGLLGGMPKNKKSYEEETEARKLSRATQQSIDLSTEQKSGITITKNDAILGRNGPSIKDRRESLYEQLIDMWWRDYAQIPRSQKRDFTVEKIIHPLCEQGGRFLRWDDKSQQYRVIKETDLDDEQMLLTVMQALRNGPRRKPRAHEGETPCQGDEFLQSEQEANCPGKDCTPCDTNNHLLPYWQEAKAPGLDAQAHCPGQECKLPANDPSRAQQQETVPLEWTVNALQTENGALRAENAVLRGKHEALRGENQALRGENQVLRAVLAHGHTEMEMQMQEMQMQMP